MNQKQLAETLASHGLAKEHIATAKALSPTQVLNLLTLIAQELPAAVDIIKKFLDGVKGGSG